MCQQYFHYQKVNISVIYEYFGYFMTLKVGEVPIGRLPWSTASIYKSKNKWIETRIRQAEI